MSRGGANATSRRGFLQATAACLAGACGLSRAAAADFTVAPGEVKALPDVPLLTMNGRRTSFARELDTDEPVLLNFVFTTCSTTCSMQTAVLAALQSRLARESRRVRLLSLTIDPDNDTPAQLTQFAARFGIGRDWQFCTGRFDDLLKPQQAFDVYRGSKASHPPVLMVRAARAAPWWRISGFPSADDIHRVLMDKHALR